MITSVAIHPPSKSRGIAGYNRSRSDGNRLPSTSLPSASRSSAVSPRRAVPSSIKAVTPAIVRSPQYHRLLPSNEQAVDN
ncbi:hypothetical protein GCM10009745_09000 [Kribbella yunnanensis]|uniref:Uncharacterized protein n=1 Tax=Kribbella yunnanensis TaxID=190194 RepID=A0ABP4S7T5_9ACTN